MDSLSSIRMDVSSIGGAQFAGSPAAPPANNPVMNGAAKALGMSSNDLISALQSGQSLASIASSKGLSEDKLVAAMATSIQQANPGVSARRRHAARSGRRRKRNERVRWAPPSPRSQGRIGSDGLCGLASRHDHYGPRDRYPERAEPHTDRFVKGREPAVAG